MEQFTVGKNEDGKRIDAIIMKLLPGAGKGFIYKMLRKKNIVVNDKKTDGNARVSSGDVIKMYLSDETITGFGGVVSREENKEENPEELSEFRNWIIYEDEDIMLVNKPAGLLSQKAANDDISVNELIIEYLLSEGKIEQRGLRTFRPSVCNRLDRNTSGIICAGVSLKGSRELTRLIRDRKADKYYMCIVCGELSDDDAGRGGSVFLRSYLSKDEKSNKVRVSNKEFQGSVPVEIEYRPVESRNGYSLLEVKLITGKSHQIRAQLAAAGYPLAGDAKYGDKTSNESLRRQYGVKRQLLTAYRFSFPHDTDLENVRGKTFMADLPDDFFIRPED